MHQAFCYWIIGQRTQNIIILPGLKRSRIRKYNNMCIDATSACPRLHYRDPYPYLYISYNSIGIQYAICGAWTHVQKQRCSPGTATVYGFIIFQTYKINVHWRCICLILQVLFSPSYRPFLIILSWTEYIIPPTPIHIYIYIIIIRFVVPLSTIKSYIPFRIILSHRSIHSFTIITTAPNTQ